MSNSPFSGPFAGAEGIGGNPLEDERNASPKCPKCKLSDFHAWTPQYGGVMRRCHKCGEEWSGGGFSVGRPDFTDPAPLPGVPAPDYDLPVVQYTGASFRDPSRNFDGSDDDY